jgi:3-oxoacyl-[acyl-carrier protein] reductase
VALVTGAASGIGRATADRLAADGLAVARLDVTAGDGILPVDVSDEAAVREAVGAVREAHGPIDVVVNAAGIALPSVLPDDASYLTNWDRTFAVNLTGTLHTVRACLDDLLASEAGRIVNIASTEGLTAARSLGAYTASKHGVIGLTRSLAVDLGRRGVTANCICPGAILTGMTEGIPEADRETYARRNIPAGRYGRPDEIAHVIASLVAPEASFVNGAIIPVDGGMMAAAP